jgi:hypothetical protein
LFSPVNHHQYRHPATTSVALAPERFAGGTYLLACDAWIGTAAAGAMGGAGAGATATAGCGSEAA